MTNRAEWIRFIVGSSGDDDLMGTAGRDVILGRNGADVLEGGAGNDILVGDDVHWSWNRCYWGKSTGSHDDYLDGGAGSDLLLAGRGNDVANYTFSENLQSHDIYDGGKGVDTLRLTLTQAEWQLDSVQQDIAALEAFLACKANPYGDSGRTFHFQTFDLDVRDFEALEIRLIGGNAAPVARDDSYSLDEDTVLLVPGPGVAGNDTDAEGSALSVTLVAGPAHGALALNASGSFSYTPAANFSGDDSFTYQVNDGSLDSNVATVTLQVAAVNDVPVAADDEVVTDEDAPVSGNVIDNATDSDGDALTAALLGGPSNGTLDFAANGSYTYAPAANFFGTDSFTYQVSDGQASSNVATVTLVVAPVNDAPVAADGEIATDEDAPVTGNVINYAADTDGDALTAALLGGPNHGALVFAADGSYTYTPATDFFGADNFTYQVNDGSLDSNVATVTLQVAAVNDAPVAADDEVVTGEDAPVSGNVIDNATDAEDDALTATLIGEPSHGALVFAADGSFTYTPAADFFGTDSFTYQVSDGQASSNVATVTLQVAAVNDAPVAGDDEISIDEDAPVNGNVIDNAADADGDALTATLLGGPSHGTLNFAADGSFSYTPAANFSGDDSFTYQVSDGQASSNVATVTLQVAAVNDVPVAADGEIATDEDAPVTGNVINYAADAEDDALTAALLGGPSNGTLVFAADGSFTYTPAANFFGADSFTYQVSDGQASSNVATVTLQVAAVNDVPVAADDELATDEDAPVSSNVIDNAADTDGDALTAALLGGPSNGTLVFAADGSFTYTPAADYFGTDSFTYQVNDGSLDSNVATVNLLIAPVNDAPVAADDEIAIDEDASVSGYVTDNVTDAEDDALTATLIDGPSNGTLVFAADGSFTYTPAADYFGTDNFTYQVNDGSLDSNVATVTLQVAAVNDAPVANDDVIPEHAISLGAIRVAVIGGSASSYFAAAAQLNDEASDAFDLDATAISVRAFTTEEQWAEQLDNYDVVVLGDSGSGLDYSAATRLFQALGSFVDDGGGVVTTGWFALIFPTLSATARGIADYITPLAPQPYRVATNGSTITVIDTTHPITDGIASSYMVNARVHELAGGIDAVSADGSGAPTILARGVVNGSVATAPALVVDDVGLGRTAYFGSLQMAGAADSPDRIKDGTVDQIFERVVAWAAGERDVFAATDEDTPLAIDAARLLANDANIENDALAIGAVSARSARGAEVSLGADGNIVYDPTEASELQSLQPGQPVTDSFNYAVVDGHGGVDIGMVSLTVVGRTDLADPLL